MVYRKEKADASTGNTGDTGWLVALVSKMVLFSQHFMKNQIKHTEIG